MSKIVLYWHPMSSATPVACALAELGVPHKRVKIDITTGEQAIVARAPSTNVGENLRIYGIADDAPESLDQRACVTWSAGIDQIAQPGIALRVRTDGDRVRGVLVTNNILFGARWGFNIQVTDSAAPTPITKIGTLWVDWANDPLPWRLCARVVGSTVTVKLHAAVCPDFAVAVHCTGVSPTGNSVPGRGVQATAAASPTLAVGTS